MSHGELVSHQPDFDGNWTDLYASSQPGPPLPKLSQSRLEAAAFHLDHPEAPIPDPRERPTLQHLTITRGLIVHHLKAAYEAFRAALSYDSKNYRDAHLRRLPKIASSLFATTPPQISRPILSILSHPEAVVPGNPEFKKPRAGAYHHIAAAVIALHKQLPPFTDTPGLPFPDGQSEFPFPNPAGFAAAWDEAGQEHLITEHIVPAMFAAHETGFAQGRHALLHTDHYTPAVSEMRVAALIPQVRAIWSGRLDFVTFGQDPDPGPRRVLVQEVKSGQLPPPPNPDSPPTAVQTAQSLALFVNAQLLAHTPAHIEARGTAQRPSHPLEAPDKDTVVTYEFTGLATSPPTTRTVEMPLTPKTRLALIPALVNLVDRISSHPHLKTFLE